MTMKRGCPQVLVNIAESLTSSRKEVKRHEKTAKTLMKWSIGFPPKLRIAYLNGSVEKTLAKYPSELASTVRKRFMLRIAQRIAEATRAEGIVTGESFEKKAVQSVHSFRILDEAVKDLPVYRPLLGLGYNEIASTAEKIGLAKTMMRKAVQLGTETEMALERIKEIEHRLDSEKIIDDTIKSMKTIELGDDPRVTRLNL
jgi:adenylyl- and sulfurtransferase ThiI